MRTAKTTITEITMHGRPTFRLTYASPAGRKREHFSDRKQAMARMKIVQDEQRRFGLSAGAMSSSSRADAAAAEKILAGSGLTLVEVARTMLAQKQREESGVPIADAVAAFMESRGDRSKDYLVTLKGRADYISNFFAGRKTTGITAADCQQMLDALDSTSSPGTVRHYRTQLSMLFNFCRGRGWASGNPAEATSQIKVTGAEVEILAPKDAAALLANCSPDILPGVTLALFCGLRAAEIERLDWRAIDLAQGIVTIGAAVAKTNSRRVCAIPENARAWLARHAQESGNVWMADHSKARDLWTLARVQSGYGPFFTDYPPARAAQTDPKTEKPRKDLRPWPHNALRHSAISYRVALEKDLAKIAYESGNSPAIIQRHYNGLASPQTAKAFFSITPDTAANVLLFSTQAA